MEYSIVKFVAGLLLIVSVVQTSGTLNILIKMIPEQQAFFKNNILNAFEKECGCKIDLHTFQDDWELTGKLKESKVTFDVVKVPMNMAKPLAAQNLMKPVENVVKGDELHNLKSTYFLIKEGQIEGKQVYLPRKFETRIMVYIKSKVGEAQQNWQKHKRQINKALKYVTHNELPKGYILEKDPGEWDYLDIFVVGYYWQLKSKGKGRVTHRGKKYSGTSLGLIDRCYQMGAGVEDVKFLKSDFFTEVLSWESFYASSNVYNHNAWSEGWGGMDIWEAFARGEVYLSFLTQIDCYFLQGIGVKKYLNQSQDLGYATNPQAVTLMTNESRQKSVTTGGWLWGIGAKTSQQAIALDLIKFITNHKNQINEIKNFGMISVRKDILGKSNIGFKEQWKNDVFNISLKQIRLNKKQRLPYSSTLDQLEKSYYKIWIEVITSSIDNYIGVKKIKQIQVDTK